MLTIKDLKEFGADTDAGLGRCLGNEAMYLRFVGMALKDPAFERLPEAAASGDLASAFEAAHSLKGVVGNLAITPLYDALSDITELLRARTEMDYSEKLDAIKALVDQLRALC